MNVLLILNDPPYGSERSYNGLRLAVSLAKREGVDVRVFLTGDAVACAMVGQKVPEGFYNLERMIEAAARHGAEVSCCGACMDARGITEVALDGQFAGHEPAVDSDLPHEVEPHDGEHGPIHLSRLGRSASCGPQVVEHGTQPGDLRVPVGGGVVVNRSPADGRPG